MNETVLAVISGGEQLLPDRVTSDGTLRRIQEVALVCFADAGYHGVSIRDLARTAGLQSSSLYAHVRSKEQLLFDLALLAHTEHRDSVQQAVLSGGGEPVDQLRAFVRAHVAMHATFRMLARVANRELGALSPDNERRVRGVREEAVGLLEGIIARGNATGAFHVPEPFLTAAAIGAMGIRVAEWWTPDSQFSAEQVADYYADIALKIVS